MFPALSCLPDRRHPDGMSGGMKSNPILKWRAERKREMKLVIAEKPSVAMALAKVVGARERKDGYMEGKEYLVSWCVGHLVAFCDASEYDERYKKWRYEDLPIIPEEWKRKVLDGTKKQFQILKKLMNSKEVDEVICATDVGRILRTFKIKKNVEVTDNGKIII